MNEPVAAIVAHLGRFARRERALLVVEAAGSAVAVVAAAWLVGVAAVNAGGALPGWPTVAGVVGAGILAGAWPLRRWRDAGAVRRHAARAERLYGAFEGELLTVLDRAARPMGSAALVERMAHRVLEPVLAVAPQQAVPADRARRVSGASAALLAALAVCTALDYGPMAVLGGLARAPAASPAPVVAGAGPRAVVGDITLRYLYPTYTGLAPLEVPNSNGDIHAPPGTRVEVAARTERAWDRASLRAFGAELPAELGAERGVRGALDVPVPDPALPEPVWRFEFAAADVAMPSPDYRIVVDADLAPQVTLDVPRNRVAVRLDQPVGVPWHVHDDYGIRKVVVEVTEGGTTREVALRDPVDVPRDLEGRIDLTAAALGLKPGSRAELRVKSWDNDEVSGSKAGRSAAVSIEVAGPGGDLARLLPQRKLLRDALVPVLAEFLTEPAPAVEQGSDAAGWVQRAAARYTAVDDLLARDWAGGQGVKADQVALKQVADTRRALFALASGLPKSDRLAPADGLALAEAQDRHIEAVEGAILVFDAMLQRAALQRVSELAAQLADEAAELHRDFASLGPENAAAARARLDQLRRLLKDLREAAAQMGDGGLREFTNDSADRLSDLMDEAQRALAEGRYDDARTQLDRIAEQMRQFADGLKDQQARQSQQSDALGNAMKDLDAELERLQADQQALRERTEQAQERFGSSMDAAVAVWKEIEKRATSASTGAASLSAAAGAQGGGVFRAAGDLEAEAGGLLDAARSRNAERTRARAESTASEANGVASMMAWAARQRGTAVGPAASTVVGIRADAERILELLDRLESAAAPPALQQALQQLAEQQQQIASRAQALNGKATSVARELPMRAPGLEEGVKQASEQAGRAADAMRDGDPMSATGGQQSVEDGLREAREALQQAASAMQSMAQEGGEGKEGGAEPGDDGAPGANLDMPIPTPEEFETPEAYRRALMEGMQGQVPDPYKASNLRYYEELFRQ